MLSKRNYLLTWMFKIKEIEGNVLAKRRFSPSILTTFSLCCLKAV